MIAIDVSSEVPLVDQIVTAIRESIARGHLAQGAEVPSARQLADDLGIHWNTVARAYRVLADDGLLFVARGRRTLVKPTERPAASAKPARDSIRASVREIMTTARLAGFDENQIKRLIDEEIHRWNPA